MEVSSKPDAIPPDDILTIELGAIAATGRREDDHVEALTEDGARGHEENFLNCRFMDEAQPEL